MITGSGAKIGFITTAGHRDVLPMMRIIGRSTGCSEIELKQYSYSEKPTPIVPKTRIKEVHERIDHKGTVVMPLNEASARKAVRELEADGVQAIGVCFLWSFKNRSHEQRMREIILEEATDMHVSISSDIVPAVKEYERSATTAVNAHVAPLLTSYLSRLQDSLRDRGLDSPLLVMQSMGGAMHASESEHRSVNTLSSGPAGGIVAANFLGDLLGHRNIIGADVGGTSFDVGLISDGEPIITSTSTVNQYTLLAPTIDIVSIGAGGGSIAWADLGRLKVGPMSAGADPGPACYGRGGDNPTVTDADVALGYIDPDYFLGGDFKLDRKLAHEAIERKIAKPLGMSVRDAASGIIEIVNHHMSDLIRKMTIERGYDPRDFVVYGFGGAGPLHGGAFGRELGVKEVVFPLGNISAAFSALGLAVSDLTNGDPAVGPRAGTLRSGDRRPAFQDARSGSDREPQGRRRQARQNYRSSALSSFVTRAKSTRWTRRSTAGRSPQRPSRARLRRFEGRYERLYGRGSGFREAGIELVTYRSSRNSPHSRRVSQEEGRLANATRQRLESGLRIFTGARSTKWSRRTYTAARSHPAWRSTVRPSIRFEATTGAGSPRSARQDRCLWQCPNHEHRSREMSKSVLKIPGSEHFAAQGKRPEPSAISPQLKIFPYDPAHEVDPITLEVVGHKLWQINDEQGQALKKISGSPVATDANDFTRRPV